ncbi:MAG: succinate dehydrogenase assembly factor 2 [Rhodobacteraceae bacterium]|nr:succinate dehydrogenase assembly factor 2 [Paracoccaceae bacterium]MCY4251475.1 succinate dehydrogenase assembly factor 2 [Paracoccaceae bacterium]MCY4308847.1 succinate dehydrogenase assembly factor 2 [Paracoccaceae bacterium]
MSDYPARIKKLQVRSHLRGTKEICELLGTFAKKNLINLDEKGVRDFENLLEFSDPEITDWLFGYANPPCHLNQIIETIIEKYK